MNNIRTQLQQEIQALMEKILDNAGNFLQFTPEEELTMARADSPAAKEFFGSYHWAMKTNNEPTPFHAKMQESYSRYCQQFSK